MVSPLGTPELDQMHDYEDACYNELEEEEEYLTFLEYCDSHNLDPEEEVFYQHADYQHDLDR